MVPRRRTAHPALLVRCGEDRTLAPLSPPSYVATAITNPANPAHPPLPARNSEPVTRLAERALRERQDLGGGHRKHQGGTTVFVVEGAIAHPVPPSPIP